MKKNLSILTFLIIGICFTSCSSNTNTVWEDTKTMGRYLQRKGKLLWKQDVDSKMIESEDEFTGPQEEEYIPLKDEDLKTQFADLSIPQPKQVPGAIGSGVPGIDKFVKPTSHLATLFQNLYFNTDEHVLRKAESFKTIADIADYMKKHENLYIFVAGHCDERASEAYNLALGTRRANTVRSLLVKKGVNPNHIYTISFGKEMPADLGHTAEAWSKNRRVEFKIFDKDAQ